MLYYKTTFFKSRMIYHWLLPMKMLELKLTVDSDKFFFLSPNVMLKLFTNNLHHRVIKQELQNLCILLYLNFWFSESWNFKSYAFLTSHTKWKL